MEFFVLLTSVADVKAFVDATMTYPHDVDVLTGRYVVNGKSIMGLFSIDLSRPVMVRLAQAGPEADALKQALAHYLHEL